MIRRLTFHWPLAVLSAIFLAIVLSWIRLIPLNAPPDEILHYHFNVEFLLRHRRLPVSGVDDTEAYQTRMPKRLGRATTLNSYVIYPALPYVTAAAAAAISHRTFGISEERGARLASAFWGFLFLVFLYGTAWSIAQRRWTAALIAAGFAFIPQVLYIASYINADIYSLALSAGAVFFFVRWLQRVDDNMRAWAAAAAAGFLASAKYNYALYAPLLAAALFFAQRWQAVTRREVVRWILKAGAMAALLSGPWYLRNFLLYDDPLGQHFLTGTMARYNPPTLALRFSWFGWLYLYHWNWFGTLFDSFFALFGRLDVAFPQLAYRLLRVAVAIWSASFAWFILEGRDERERIFFIAVVLFFLGNVFLAGWNAMTYDFQAQGRYLFPSIVPMAALLARVCRRSPQAMRWAILLPAMMGIFVLMSLNLMARTY